MAGIESGSRTFPDSNEIYDAGSLGCGDGPLSTIATKLRDMPAKSILEVRSTDPAVAADLPAWCRMTGHTFLGGDSGDYQGRYFVQKRPD